LYSIVNISLIISNNYIIYLLTAHGCKPVYYIDHGHVILGYGGAMIKFSCDEGFNIVGDRIMICDGKNWNTTIPKCKGWLL